MKKRWVLPAGCAVLLAVIIYQVAGGRGGNLAYLAFLLCPLMHLFMGHGHRHGSGGSCHDGGKAGVPDGGGVTRETNQSKP